MELLLTVTSTDGAPRDLRVEVDPTAPAAELIDALARTVGASGDLRAWIGRTRTQVLPDRPVAEARLVHGDELELTPPDTPPAWALTDPTMSPPAYELVAVGGPRAGSRFPLVVGRSYEVGRDDSSDISLEDSQASRRHLHVGVGSKAVGLTDLGSTNGTFVDGRRLTEPTDIRPGQVIEVGSTLLSLEAPSAFDVGRASIAWHDGRFTFSRPPRTNRPLPDRTVSIPAPPLEPPKRRVPVVASVIPVVMGGVMAFFLGPIMLLFALMGPVMLAATTIEDRKSGRKAYKGQRERYDQALAGLEVTVTETHEALLLARRAAAPNPATLVARVRDHAPELWERRLVDADFLALRLGTSDMPSQLLLDVALPPPTMAGDEATEGEIADRARVAALTEAHRLDPSVPVDVGLTTIGVLGVAGDDQDRDALLRWLVIQAATLSSPRDLAIVALVPQTEVDRWAWLRWLPHTETLLAGVPEARTAAAQTDDARALFQVVDDLVTQRRIRAERGGTLDHWDPHVLVMVPGDVPIPKPAMSRLLAAGPALGVSFLVGAASAEHLPGECRAVVRTTGSGNDASVTITSSGDTVPGIVVDGLTLHLAADTARRLAPLQDATASAVSGEVPRRVLLLDLLELPEPTSELVRSRWDAHAGTGELGAPVGMGSAGAVTVDLRRDGPHALAAGTTGAGKSELLQSFIGSLAATYPASMLTFVLVDYKGGAAFKDCVALPHTVGFFTDLDTHLAQRALISLNAELRKREEVLREHGTKDLMELEQRSPDAAPANLFIVFDEFAFLKKEVPEFVAGVIDIAQRGRSLGVHLMLATQRPSGVVDDNIRANTNMRLALRMADEADSTDVLDRPDAAHIPKSLPGRCYLRLGHSDVTMVQSAYANARTQQGGSTRQPTTVTDFALASGLREAAGTRSRGAEVHDERPTDLQRLVAAIGSAHRDGSIADQPKPWLDPLADCYDLRALLEAPTPDGTSELASPLGVVDLPTLQTQEPHWYDLGTDGHLLVYGTSGTGKTQLVRTIATGLATRLSPDDLHLYGLDFASRGLRSLTALPHTGGVVNADEPERIDRLFGVLDELVAERKGVLGEANASSLPEFRAAGGTLPHVVVLLDGYGTFHQTYLNVDRGELVDRFARIVGQGRAVGLTFVITADRRNAIPTALSSAITSRLVLRMADSDEYASLGLPSALAEAKLTAGRGFLGGDELQVAVVGDDPSGAGQAAAVEAWGRALTDQHAGGGRAAGVTIVPDQVTLADLGLPVAGSAAVPFALSGTDLRPVVLDFDDSPVFVVLGPDRSGRTTALATVVDGVLAARPGMEAYLLAPRRTPLADRDGWTEVARGIDACDDLARRLEDIQRDRAGHDQPWVVVIDDGDELVDGLGANAISALVRKGRDAGLIVLVAVQTHTAHRAFGGWVTDIRKAKHGLILEPQVDLDGDLFGLRLPQRASRRFPPGRGYLVRRGGIDYVQVATGP